MKNRMHSARGVIRTAAILAAALSPAACDVKNELLQPQNPGVVDQSAVGSPAAAAALKIGAIGRLKYIVSDPSSSGFGGMNVWEAGGLLADEFMNSDFQNGMNDVDARNMSPDTPYGGNYSRTTQIRGYIRDAIAAETAFEPSKTADIGELWMSLGFVELSLAENFCNGIPLGLNKAGVVDYSSADFKPRTNAEVLQVAITHFDSALAVIGSSNTTDAAVVKNAATIAKARALVDLGQFSAAAALVSSIQTSYQYLFITQASSNSEDLGIWTLNNSIARVSVSDSVVTYGGKQFQTVNAIPFASLNDPRVPILKGTDAKIPAEDAGQTPLFIQQIWKNRDDPIPMVSGLDARLIEAEAKLQANDFGGMMTILNALRAAPPKNGNFQPATMTAISTTPATAAAATDLFFREKALWQFGRGYRLNDLRRLVRQYKRAQNTVFPTGQQYKGVVYGSDTSLPVPDGERVNPQFSGCIDKNA